LQWQRDRKESDGAPTICYEDVAVEIVRGGDRIIVRDYNDEDEDVVIELERAKQNLSNAEGWTFEQVIHVLQETGSPDAWSYFNIIQQAMFGRVIYG
jgi:predicted PolB exonuclease-like 3'-5' exonuclease